MKFLSLIFFTFLLTINAEARKPAVEEFVGVIPENYQATPKGTEVLFDFKKELNDKSKNNPNGHIFQSNTSSVSTVGTYGLLLFVTLPFLMWYGLTRTTHKDRVSTSESTEIENQQEFNLETKMIDKDKIAKLEDYRNKDKNHKKVS